MVLLAAACRQPEIDREAVLRQTLAEMRAAIRRHHTDTGRYPESLQALIPKYLPAVPPDPITGSTRTWRLTTEETVVPNTDFTATAGAASRPVITDVHSGAGVPWSDY